MSQIQIQHLYFSYEGSCEEVFHDVSLSLDTDWKLGLVGRNGRGKTTLLRLLSGELSGQGRISAPVSFTYFPFPVEHPERDGLEIAQSIHPQCELWMLCRELSCLNLDAGILYRPFHTLSFGERTKLLLAILFLKEQHFLLIDEPTNHLDLEGRNLLAQYLKKKKGFLLVSHDRRFLDTCTDHTMSINKNDIEIVKGNFSVWWDQKNMRDQSELLENERLKKEIARLKEASRQTRDWSENVEKSKFNNRVAGLRPDRGAIGHKAAKMMKRSKVTEARMSREIQKKEGLLKNVEQAEPLKLFPLPHHKTELVNLSDLSLGYGGRTLFSPLSLTIKAGEKAVITGPNGSGKSTLLHYLLKQARPASGEEEPCPKEDNLCLLNGRAMLPAGLIVSYVSQDTSYLRGTPEQFAQKQVLDQTVFYMLLRKLDFSREHLCCPMEALSEGQKKKILLAKSLSERAHLYLWDEPLNYIDIFSRMQLLELLQNTKLTMLLIEHDQSFVEALTDRVYRLTDN